MKQKVANKNIFLSDILNTNVIKTTKITMKIIFDTSNLLKQSS